MKRLVLCVEGEGDVEAIPALVGRLLSELPPDLQGHTFLDNRPLRVGGVEKITGKNRQSEWTRFLQNARMRRDLGAVLLILDGDADTVEDMPFCAAHVARMLAVRAAEAGGGTAFSVAVVFIRQEYESLLIAAAKHLPGISAETKLPADVEESPRDAKGWLDKHLPDGCTPTTDQILLTQAIDDWQSVRESHNRSFRRLENALVELVTAVSTGNHVCTPINPPTPSAP